MYLETTYCTASSTSVQMIRRLASAVSKFRIDVEKLDRAAQACHESKRLRALLEPKRHASAPAVRQLSVRCRTQPVARSGLPARFAYYQGTF